MMFLLRGAVISLGSFFLIYTAASVLVAGFWRLLHIHRRGEAGDPTWLFALRLLPLTAGVAGLALLVIPSFLLMEPADPREGLALWGAMAAAAGFGVIGFGLANAWWGWTRTQRKLAPYLRHTRKLESSSPVPVFEIDGEASTCLVVGIFRPALLVSGAARKLLAGSEFQAALRHEMAHIRRLDNFKKLVLRLCAFPGMATLEREWLRATEMAADEAACCDENTALELAAALVKLAHAGAAAATPELAMSLLPEGDAPLAARVARLLSWRARPKTSNRWTVVLVAGPAAVFVLAFHYLPVLSAVHELTELLVR